MYVPPYEYILTKLGVSAGEIGDDDMIQVPLKFVKMLLQFALANQPFDEEAYNACYPDVSQAVDKGLLRDGLYHYIASGYFEGRRNVGKPVDEQWYLKVYPDLTEAIKAKAFQSGAEHFYSFGAKEGRVPNENCVQDMDFWNFSLQIKEEQNPD